MGILFWVIFCLCFPFVLFYLIKRELPRLFPLVPNFLIGLSIFTVAVVVFILTYSFSRPLMDSAALLCLLIAGSGFLPRLPQRLQPWRDTAFAFALGIALFSPLLGGGIPPGPDVWAKPYLARSAATSIVTVTEPGWDIGWMLGFDYTVYGAFSPVMSGIFALISGDHFAGVRLEMFNAFIFLPPLAYLAGRRTGRNRWGGFVALIVLLFARMALGYIGIARFWALALFPALWLALEGWRAGKRGYAPLVALLLAAASFIHAQVGVMALLLFSGFSLEMLWRRRKGILKSWIGIIMGTAALTAIWWQNILESAPAIYTAPDFAPWNPGTLHQAWQMTDLILRQSIDFFRASSLLPDIYSHAWYLGAFTALTGVIGLMLWLGLGKKRSGIFPALWAGGLVFAVNLPVTYTIPIVGDFIQHLTYPDFSGDDYNSLSLGLLQRYLLLSWLALGLLAARIPAVIARMKNRPLSRILAQTFLVLLTLVFMEQQPFTMSALKCGNGLDPRIDLGTQDVEEYLGRQPADEKILYDLPIDYGGILQSSLNTVPVLQGWIASGYNYNFAFNYLWPLQVSVEHDPPRVVRMLAAVGVRHFIMLDEIKNRVLAARMGRLPVAVYGTWMFAQIPNANGYLSPARLININDKRQIDYDGWSETPWKAYSLGDTCYQTMEDDLPPAITLREMGLRRTPNRVKIDYTLDEAGVLSCNLAYQPALRATLDGKSLPIAENMVNGLIWFASPPGEHELCLYRIRSASGWMALITSTIALFILLYLMGLLGCGKNFINKWFHIGDKS